MIQNNLLSSFITSYRHCNFWRALWRPKLTSTVILKRVLSFGVFFQNFFKLCWFTGNEISGFHLFKSIYNHFYRVLNYKSFVFLEHSKDCMPLSSGFISSR